MRREVREEEIFFLVVARERSVRFGSVRFGSFVARGRKRPSSEASEAFIYVVYIF